MKTNIKIAELVKSYRLKNSMTQLQVAKQLGYDSMQFVSLFERGVSKVPVETLGKLSVILGIPEAKITNLLVTQFKLDYYKKFDAGKEALKGKV